MASNLYVRDLCNQLHKLDINEPSIDNIKHSIQQKCSIPIHHQHLWHNGKLITSNTPLPIPTTYTEISLSLSLNGGKGGFGSMLRAAGKLNKTTNKSAMRDLSGRRYRFVEQENEMREWIKQQKTNKPMSQREIQNDFSHIKKYGTLPEKRMCHRGINCRYRHKCKFRHPDDIDKYSQKKNQNKTQKSRQIIAALDTQTDEEMRNALLMGKLNANCKAKANAEQSHKKTKKIVPLFGADELNQCLDDSNDDIDMSNNSNINDINVDVSDDKISGSLKEFLHECHAHKLKWIMREDCDFVICDLCDKQYNGPSWHCCKGCDFDLCDDCVIIDAGVKGAMDEHLNEYNKESNEMKQILQKDAELMNMKAFSSNIGRKRKRKERKLGLLGLETVRKSVRVQQGRDELKDEVVTGKSGQEQRLRGDVNARYAKDPNEILIDMDLLFPIDLIKVRVVNDMKGDIDLNGIENVDELKKNGMDKLKMELQLYGLKCGGTLEQRAERLFLLKNNKLSDLPKNCFVSKKKKKGIKKPPRKKQKVGE